MTIYTAISSALLYLAFLGLFYCFWKGAHCKPSEWL